jgi:hypothetical protein
MKADIPLIYLPLIGMIIIGTVLLLFSEPKTDTQVDTKTVTLMTKNNMYVRPADNNRLEYGSENEDYKWIYSVYNDGATKFQSATTSETLCRGDDNIVIVTTTCQYPITIDSAGNLIIRANDAFYLGLDISGSVAWLRENYGKTNIICNIVQ